MSRITRNGADWLAPRGGITAWQRERAHDPVVRSLRRATWGDVAATLLVAAFAVVIILACEVLA